MAPVTAKAVLSSVTLGTTTVQLTFQADYADGRNKEWAPFTPALTYTMAVKPEVYEQHFELGASYTVTFERAVDETPQSPAVPI